MQTKDRREAESAAVLKKRRRPPRYQEFDRPPSTSPREATLPDPGPPADWSLEPDLDREVPIEVDTLDLDFDDEIADVVDEVAASGRWDAFVGRVTSIVRTLAGPVVDDATPWHAPEDDLIEASRTGFEDEEVDVPRASVTTLDTNLDIQAMFDALDD